MTRHHRRWHVWVWLVLGLLVGAGYLVGLLARPAWPNVAPSEPKVTEVSE